MRVVANLELDGEVEGTRKISFLSVMDAFHLLGRRAEGHGGLLGGR